VVVERQYQRCLSWAYWRFALAASSLYVATLSGSIDDSVLQNISLSSA